MARFAVGDCVALINPTMGGRSGPGWIDGCLGDGVYRLKLHDGRDGYVWCATENMRKRRGKRVMLEPVGY